MAERAAERTREPVAPRRRTEIVPVEGGDIRADVFGEGPPVVLLHGWTFDARIWRPQIAALAASRTVVALDRRGFGRSTAPPSLACEVQDLTIVQEALGLGRLALVGMSQGGRVALRFAAAHGEALTALVVFGAPLDGLAPDPAAPEQIPVADYAALVRAGRLADMRARWLTHPLLQADEPAATALLGEIVGDYDGRDLMASDMSGGARWPAPALGAIDTPTLVLTGDNDPPARRRAGDAIAAGLPRAVRCEIRGGGHVCNVTHPAEFNSLVTDFLDRVGA